MLVVCVLHPRLSLLLMSNFDFTDKTEETIAAAVQLAKDYAQAQVQPAHIAFALLNDGSGDNPDSLNAASGKSLFASVIEKAGGDPVCFSPIVIRV